MDRQRNFLLFAAMAAAAALPAAAQTALTVGSGAGETHSAAAIPDFSRAWNHPAFPWFEPPASGPGPITNLSRWPEQRAQNQGGSAALPASKVGISNYDQLVGDYKNPILQPWAAAVVKRFGELSLAGITYPNASNQCWPFPMPFIYKQQTVQLIQQPDKITMLYSGQNEVRRVRLNEPHPSPLSPSWYGDSVGHYEGDTLVVDTIGVKTDRPYAMIDLFGTPYTDKLHVVERYRLRDYDQVKDALERNRKELAVQRRRLGRARARQVPPGACDGRGCRRLHRALDRDAHLRAGKRRRRRRLRRKPPRVLQQQGLGRPQSR